MFPFRDHNPSSTTPVVTMTLIALNVLVFVLSLSATGSERATYAFYNDWALVPAYVTSGQHLYSVITSMFLHGGFMHLAGNMLFLWIFGDNLEDEMGHVGFLLFYLAAGAVAAAAQVAAGPYSQVPMLGASGAIAGVMGGYLLLYPKARVDVLFFIVIFVQVIAVPAWVVLSIWFVVQLFSGIGAADMAGGVAYWAHAGGFVAGIAFTLPIWLRRGGAGYWTRTQGAPPHAPARYRIGRSHVPTVRRHRR